MPDTTTYSPARTSTGWAWYACGGDNYALDTAKGIIPLDLARRLHGKGDIKPTPGNGGEWFSTRAKAVAALRAAFTFGDIIAALRRERGLSAYQLAKDAGMDATGLGRIEKGVNQPSWDTVQKLADALGVSTEELRTLPS